jgi:hypothetical protein
MFNHHFVHNKSPCEKCIITDFIFSYQLWEGADFDFPSPVPKIFVLLLQSSIFHNMPQNLLCNMPPAARGALFEKTAPLDPPQKLLIKAVMVCNLKVSMHTMTA